MNPRDFIQQLCHEEIVAAIADAEKKTSGEIRVFVSHKAVDDPVSDAQAQFVRMGMTNTRDRNGVLIFVAPRTQKFAVLGDEAVHRFCGEEFWRSMAVEMTEHFKKADFTHGLVHVIRRAGELLAQHFPPRPDDTNELSNKLEHD